MDAVEPDVKARLIAATEELLLQPREFAVPTMRAIAARAGVTPGAAYKHFAGQEELLNAAIAAAFHSFGADLVAVRTAAIDPDAALAAIAAGYVSWGLANPGVYQLMFEATNDGDVFTDLAHPGHALLEQLAVVVSAVRGETAPNLGAALRLWTYLHGTVSLRTHRAQAPWHSLPPDDLASTVAVLARS
jgi:AcrR family transcriptional regulator